MSSILTKKLVYIEQYNLKILLYVFMFIFVYALSAGLFIQLYAIPVMFPHFNLGDGLVVLDSVGFDSLAKEKSAEIVKNGWSAWELKPRDQLPSGIASALYAIWTPRPYVMLPFNSIVHALSGCVVVWMLMNFFSYRSSIVGGMMFSLNPAAMEWVAQIHRDGVFVLGILLLLTCMIKFSIDLKSNKIYNVGLGLLWGLVGTVIVWLARPFWVQVLIISIVIWGVSLIIIICVFKKQTIKRSNLAKIIPFIIVLIFFQGWLVSNNNINFESYDFKKNAEQKIDVNNKTDVNEINANDTLVNAANETIWKYSSWTPDFIERKLYQISTVRHSTLLLGGNTLVDSDVELKSVSEFVKYFPRALQIGLLSPMPEFWTGEGSTSAMSVARKIMGVTTIVFYICLVGLFLNPKRLVNKIEFLAVFILCLIGILLYSYTHPNIGTLLRYRYGFYMLLVSIGAANITETIILYIKKQKQTSL